jgi:prepilin signal peptidase PulO-like enzyme (type II secretory pathway)
MWLGFYAAIEFGKLPLETSLLSTVLTYGFLKLLSFIYLYGFNKTALGDADPLLAGAIGAWLNPLQIPYFFSFFSHHVSGDITE